MIRIIHYFILLLLLIPLPLQASEPQYAKSSEVFRVVRAEQVTDPGELLQSINQDGLVKSQISVTP
jgi:hypothetical protein